MEKRYSCYVQISSTNKNAAGQAVLPFVTLGNTNGLDSSGETVERWKQRKYHCETHQDLWCFKGTSTGHVGNCQKLVFALGVSLLIQQITSLWKFGLNWLSKLQENSERKNRVAQNVCAIRCTIKYFIQLILSFWVRNYLFLKIYVTSEGAVSHNVLYYQYLSVACY